MKTLQWEKWERGVVGKGRGKPRMRNIVEGENSEGMEESECNAAGR